MKHRLMDMIHCIQCEEGLQLHIDQKEFISSTAAISRVMCSHYCSYKNVAAQFADIELCVECYNTEIKSGELTCSHCGTNYPIHNGIPRFLSSDKNIQRKTSASFGFQWQTFQVTAPEEDVITFFLKTGIDADLYNKFTKNPVAYHTTSGEIDYSPNGAFLKNAVVLDAGCGMGRYLNIANKYGAEVFGVDLSLAVERAYKVCRDNPHTHVVQGNLMQLPFRKERFSFIYSIGVLHHTPGTREAFMGLVPLLKKGGSISIWVYPKFNRKSQDIINNLWRAVTTRLPIRFMYRLSPILGGSIGGIIRNLYYSDKKLPHYTGAVLTVLFPVSTHPKEEVRACDTFDWLTPEYQWKHSPEELQNWYSEAGLCNTISLPIPVSMTGKKE